MPDNPKTLSADDLHALLDQLLSSASAEGNLEPEAFWRFVAGLAQERGIVDHLHAAGIAAVNEVVSNHRSPANTFNERRERAYHIGLLVQLLLDIGGLPQQASVLPGNFDHGALISDLQTMLAGPGGTGEATPQVLYSLRDDATTLRHHAQRIIVGAVNWQAAHDNPSDTRLGIKPIYGRYGVTKEEYDEWSARFGGAKGEWIQYAREEGRKGDNPPRFLNDIEYRDKIIACARGRHRAPN